ncbi:MAG: putative lipopolysaccharide heptosyltransferase III [Planctomycetota bacterium]|nr:putative lipopolysaccharide heptosyltransferase III [Planctomycetota bacterium]
MQGNFKKVLIIKLRYIGDVLLTTPVIRCVRENLPDVYISVLVNKGTEDTILYNPDINEILLIDRGKVKGGNVLSRMLSQLRLILDIRKKMFDLVIDLTDGDRAAILSYISGAKVRVGFNSENKIRGRLYNLVVRPEGIRHIVDYQLEAVSALGLKIDRPELVLNIPEEYDAYVKETLKGFNIDEDEPYVIIHPGGRWWFKCWPPESYAGLIDRIQGELGIKVVITGGGKEEKVVEKIISFMKTKPYSLLNKTTILQLASIIKRACLFVGNDNGPMHISVAVGTPVIALFGSSDPRVWGPWGANHTIIYKSVECSPCRHTGCDKGEYNCMKVISVEEVMKEVWKRLQRGYLINQTPLQRF